MKTILVVDDEQEIRTLTKIILEKEGYGVLEAEDGASALELAKARIPDLIVSDVMMENVNGFMLFEFLKEDSRTEKIPMILMTGQAQGAGAWNLDPNIIYLQKPIGRDQLLAAVRKKIEA